MKLRLTFKTPSVLHDAAKEKLEHIVEEETQDGNLGPEDVEELRYETFHKLMHAGRQFVRDGEYITIEIDTDTLEAMVLKA